MFGIVERVADDRIEGWIVDTENPDAELTVRVFLDDREVTQGFVTRLRQDVIDAGHTRGVSGFSIPFSVFHHGCLPGVVRVVEARTGWQLRPGPLRFEPAPANPGALPLADLEPRIAARIARLENSEALASDLAVLMRQFSHAVDRANALAATEAAERDFARKALLTSGSLGGALGHFASVISERYPQIDFAPVERPEVSIIIPVHNKFELTYDCLKSIYRNPQKTSFEIILVDDLSSDETLLAALVFTGAVRVARNARNLGFVGACNAGAETARGRFLYFLNNDTIVSGEWLDALARSFADPRTGIVGSRLLNADFSLQECGGIIWSDGTAWNYGRGADPSHPDYRYLRDADYVSGAALMIRADLFRELGGFDRLYEPAYYEDADLCLRARQAGHAVRVQPGSTIIHLEGRSNGTELTSGLKRYQVVNQIKFVRRWRDALKAHGDNGVNPHRAAQRYIGKRALFIDDTAPTPDRDAGSLNAVTHIRALQSFGYHVVFVPSDNMADLAPYTARLEQEGVECVYAPYYWSLEDWLRRRAPEMDLVYLHRFSNANNFMALVRRFCPNALVVYNVADLHSLRQKREQTLGVRASDQRKVSEAREIELIGAADLALVPSSFELEYVRERAPGANVHCIAWPVEAADKPPGFAERTGLGFVGGYRHTPNVDAMEFYASEIQPRLQALQPGLRLEMAGSDMPEKLHTLESETLKAIGHVEDLDGFLMRLKATVAPLRWGAGLKGKVLSSFGAGTPCMMTSVAAEGMDLPDALKVCVADDPGEIAVALNRLTTDEGAWAEASAAGLAFVRERYGRERIEGLLDRAIKDAQRCKKMSAAAE